MMSLKLLNRAFLIGSVLFILLGISVVMFSDKGSFVCYLGNIRTPEGLTTFSIITQLGEIISYLIIIVILLFIKIRWSLSVLFTGLLVAVLSPITKFLFKQPRPLKYLSTTNYPCQLSPVEGIEALSGLTSFPSGHTMSAFALMSMIAFIGGKNVKWGLISFTLALLVAISRIYLGHHFLEDTLAGAFLGIMISVFVQYIFTSNNKLNKDWMEKPILTIKLVS